MDAPSPWARRGAIALGALGIATFALGILVPGEELSVGAVVLGLTLFLGGVAWGAAAP
jgi:hypothetical protein